MIFTKKQTEEFEEIARQMIRFLNDNCYPHVNVIITPTRAELSEGVCSTGDIFDSAHD